MYIHPGSLSDHSKTGGFLNLIMIISAYVIRIRQVPGPPTGLKKVKLDFQGWNPNGAPCFAWKLKGLGGWRVQPPPPK